MKKMANMSGRLTLICAVAALLLGLVNAMTEPVIAERKAIEFQKALQSLVSEGKAGSEVSAEDTEGINVYYPVTKKSSVLGYIVSLTGTGYGGDLSLLSYYKADGTLQNSVLMDNSETPGLGKKAEDPSYMKKFIGSGSTEKPIPLKKSEVTVDADAITGSTITFLGVSKALKNGSDFVKELGD